MGMTISAAATYRFIDIVPRTTDINKPAREAHAYLGVGVARLPYRLDGLLTLPTSVVIEAVFAPQSSMGCLSRQQLAP